MTDCEDGRLRASKLEAVRRPNDGIVAFGYEFCGSVEFAIYTADFSSLLHCHHTLQRAGIAPSCVHLIQILSSMSGRVREYFLQDSSFEPLMPDRQPIILN